MELTHDSFYRGESSEFSNWWKNWKWNCIFTSESSLICLLSPDRHWLLQLLHQCWMLFICTHHVCCILHVCWVIKHWDRLQTLKLSPTIRGCILRSDGLAYQCHYKSYSRFASLILTDLHSSKKRKERGMLLSTFPSVIHSVFPECSHWIWTKNAHICSFLLLEGGRMKIN